MRRLIVLLVVLAMASLPALAISYYFVPDVPTDLGGVTYLPWQIVRNDSGVYSLRLMLPVDTPIDALHQMCNGDWLFSVEATTELPPGSGAFFDPRDVIRYSPVPGTYVAFFGGAGAGIPDGFDVDGAFLVGNDSSPLVLSFDVPTTVGGTTFDPADLVRYQAGAFAPYFDASAATPPIPDTVNVTGSDRTGALRVLTFDVPASLGATFLPGELVAWNGASFASYYSDPGWPVESVANALSFLADPGRVPPPTLRVARSVLTPGYLRLTWGPSTSAGAENYGIYEGTIGIWYSHTAIDCDDALGDRTEEVSPQAADSYYIVVPFNANDEGSYGTRSSSIERPVGSPLTCKPAQGLDCP